MSLELAKRAVLSVTWIRVEDGGLRFLNLKCIDRGFADS